MLTPDILTSLAVLIYKSPVIADERDLLCRGCKHLLVSSTVHTHRIKLSHGTLWKQSTCCRVLNSCSEQYILSVGSERPRCFLSGMSGHSERYSPAERNCINIEITISVRSESQCLSVRRPYRRIIICRIRGQLTGLSTLRVHDVDISLV